MSRQVAAQPETEGALVPPRSTTIPTPPTLSHAPYLRPEHTVDLVQKAQLAGVGSLTGHVHG